MQTPQSIGSDPQRKFIAAVRPVRSDDKLRWDKYVSAHSESSFFHLFDWQVLFRQAFALEPHYLIAERNGSVVGILPLVHQNSLLFGKALISSPFCVHGGPLASDDEAYAALDVAAKELAMKLKVTSLEFRSRVATRPDWSAKRGLYATFARPLSVSDEENLKAIPRKQRAVLRKAIDSDLSISVGKDVRAFFQVYSESMRNLGTPMFPKRYFDLLLTTFPDTCDVVVIRDEYVPVAAVMNFYHGDTVLPYYGGGTVKARNNGANDLLYWAVMRSATARGFRRFDFGRSKAGTGAFAFKKNWGFEPAWLEYEYWLPSGGSIPEKNPNNPVFANLSRVWKKLPLPVANFIGPFLIRGLG